MRLVFRAFCDPSFEDLLLLWSERFMSLIGRHEILFIGSEKTFDDLAFLRLTGNNRNLS